MKYFFLTILILFEERELYQLLSSFYQDLRYSKYIYK